MRIACIGGWALSAVLAVAFGATAYVFVVGGNVVASADGRTAVLLLADERDRVLGEMRALLEAVQTITAAAAEDDMASVVAAATAVGMAAAKAESPQMLGKLPLEFLRLGMGAHQAFDDLAGLAAQTTDGRVIARRMGEILLICTACHGGYRLRVEGEGGA